MSITACGSVVVWSDVLTSFEFEDEESFSTCSPKKEFIKGIKLSENPLRVIRSIERFVMICDSVGQIRFYDKELKILYWCPSQDSIDSVITISFDLKWKPEGDDGDSYLQKVDKSFSVRDFFVRKKFSDFL